MDELVELQQLSDPVATIKRANELVNHHQEVIAAISAIRREKLNDLASGGLTQREIAERIGISKARVGQLLTSGPKAERTLLGTGQLTIAVGGKAEAQKSQTSVMMSAEAFAAYELIKNTAGDLGLKAENEVIPPPGLVRLNRPNLVVIGSPRLLPLVGQMLESDRYLGFDQGAQGWYLVERATGRKFRSPSDAGEAADYAYVGRLPRPDGNGNFLYLAGIHAMGTIGAATHLINNIEDIYKKVKNRRWSVLVECRYDPDTREVLTAEAITQIYVNEGA